MSSMSSMSMTMGSTATVTSTAASATSTAMDMGGMDMGGSCKISMLWNWYTIDACFISPTWRVRSQGAFAASCIGVVLLVVSLELMRRLGKEYDGYILRKFQQQVASSRSEGQHMHEATSGPRFVTFRATPLQQLIRSIIHAVTFGVAYIVMLLAMYYNGFIIFSIIIGAGLGKFVCDWMIHQIPLGNGGVRPKADVPEEPTVCCG